MNIPAMLLDLETTRTLIDNAIASLRPLVAKSVLAIEGISIAGNVVDGGEAKPKSKSKGVAAWKHRRRCPKCEQLTSTDPCQHCGAEIAPAGARK